jgi:hypothetical protein
VTARKLIAGLIIRYVSLNITDIVIIFIIIIIPKPNILTETQNQGIFGFVTLVPVTFVSSPKQTVPFCVPFVVLRFRATNAIFITS